MSEKNSAVIHVFEQDMQSSAEFFVGPDLLETPVADVVIIICAKHHLLRSKYTLVFQDRFRDWQECRPSRSLKNYVMEMDAVPILVKKDVLSDLRRGVVTYKPPSIDNIEKSFKVMLPGQDVYFTKVEPHLTLAEVLAQICHQRNLEFEKCLLQHPQDGKTLNLKQAISLYNFDTLNVVKKHGEIHMAEKVMASHERKNSPTPAPRITRLQNSANPQTTATITADDQLVKEQRSHETKSHSSEHPSSIGPPVVRRAPRPPPAIPTSNLAGQHAVSVTSNTFDPHTHIRSNSLSDTGTTLSVFQTSSCSNTLRRHEESQLENSTVLIDDDQDKRTIIPSRKKRAAPPPPPTIKSASNSHTPIMEADVKPQFNSPIQVISVMVEEPASCVTTIVVERPTSSEISTSQTPPPTSSHTSNKPNIEIVHIEKMSSSEFEFHSHPESKSVVETSETSSNHSTEERRDANSLHLSDIQVAHKDTTKLANGKKGEEGEEVAETSFTLLRCYMGDVPEDNIQNSPPTDNNVNEEFIEPVLKHEEMLTNREIRDSTAVKTERSSHEIEVQLSPTNVKFDETTVSSEHDLATRRSPIDDVSIASDPDVSNDNKESPNSSGSTENKTVAENLTTEEITSQEGNIPPSEIMESVRELEVSSQPEEHSHETPRESNDDSANESIAIPQNSVHEKDEPDCSYCPPSLTSHVSTLRVTSDRRIGKPPTVSYVFLSEKSPSDQPSPGSADGLNSNKRVNELPQDAVIESISPQQLSGNITKADRTANPIVVPRERISSTDEQSTGKTIFKSPPVSPKPVFFTKPNEPEEPVLRTTSKSVRAQPNPLNRQTVCGSPSREWATDNSPSSPRDNPSKRMSDVNAPENLDSTDSESNPRLSKVNRIRAMFDNDSSKVGDNRVQEPSIQPDLQKSLKNARAKQQNRFANLS